MLMRIKLGKFQDCGDSVSGPAPAATVPRKCAPQPFLRSVQTVLTSAAPYFLAAGDLSGTGAIEIVLAARGGGSFFRFMADGAGGIRNIGIVTVPGRITALAAGGHAVVAGVETGGGSLLVTYQLSGPAASQVAAIPMTAAISQISTGDLGGGRDADAAVLAGGQLFILHGADGALAVAGQLEAVATAFTSDNSVLGDFVADRAHKTEIALLANDGSIHVMARGRLETGPLTPSERAQRRGRVPNAVAADPADVETWDEVRIVPPPDGRRIRKLFAGRLSRSSGEDLFAADDEGRLVQVSKAPVNSSAPPSMELEVSGALMAVVPMRLNVMGSEGLALLEENSPEPLVVSPQPNVIYHVTALNDSNAGTCTTPSGTPMASTCTTLRAAVTASNALYGENLIVFDVGGTVTLTASGQGVDEAGHLDVTNALTIAGNGPAQTVVQAGTSSANGIDKVFSFNPLGQLPGFAVSISGLSIEYGRNTFTDFSIGDNEGGAFDFDAGAEDGAGTLSIANCAILQNSTVNGDGGGIALFDGGVVTITGTTISGTPRIPRGPRSFMGEAFSWATPTRSRSASRLPTRRSAGIPQQTAGAGPTPMGQGSASTAAACWVIGRPKERPRSTESAELSWRPRTTGGDRTPLPPARSARVSLHTPPGWS
jgi:hypothetical protein